MKICPILAIGFNPPENPNEEDVRVCTEDCEWYDEGEEQCVTHSILDQITALASDFGYIADMLSETN